MNTKVLLAFSCLFLASCKPVERVKTIYVPTMPIGLDEQLEAFKMGYFRSDSLYLHYAVKADSLHRLGLIDDEKRSKVDAIFYKQVYVVAKDFYNYLLSVK